MIPLRIAELLAPYADVPPTLATQLALYLDLILKWNDRINLTAIRAPEEIVRRHFGESLFAAAHLDPGHTLLDFGSGAGFPGLPIQLAHPTLQVTLAESRSRKAAFLREAVRTLQLRTEVWPARVEAMPAEQTFDTVTLRAVDSMTAAIASAALRATGAMLILSTASSQPNPATLPGFTFAAPIALPESDGGILLIARRSESRELFHVEHP